MKTYQGKSTSNAIAIGKAFVLRRSKLPTWREHSANSAWELSRLKAAKVLAKGQLQDLAAKALQETGPSYAEIFEVHQMLLEDAAFNETIQSFISKNAFTAEAAVAAARDLFEEKFSAMEDPYFQARATDIADVADRVIRCLSVRAQESAFFGQGDEKVILCAQDLTPSETIQLDKSKIAAFVTASGTLNSHTAILARSLQIPAIVGIGEECLQSIQDGMRLMVDGFTGEVLLSPDSDEEEARLQKQAQYEEKMLHLRELIGKESVTKDGKKIKICANVGDPENLAEVLDNDADGIGLLRSEFLYLSSTDYPSEEEQFQAYRLVLERMKGKQVIIRTLDVGADKQIDYFHLDHEENPALGFRAIRLCLTHLELFRTQLRALYRASAYGNLGILFPMITSVTEVEQILTLCKQVKKELQAENLPYNEKVELGIMIETPAAALISDLLAPMVDFFSVGTNDLTQYTLALDRQNAKLDPFCDTHHEAILRLIAMAATNAKKCGTWIGICGELAADTSLTERFLRMGIDELSVSAPFVLPLRDIVRNLDLSKPEDA
ncbi:MAG: phosphoenolpyruvate--protein phosphotransferase [Lachnospiraceae bacterium]|nr:phosphoenolpyruvate--protein phosphotransferase [Lachnospiraceae bacterium]MBQ2101635.1 phosphoenolpyruvate--protein phosphotransferase [Lachnospiraceae bacterium]MBQ3905311.1 phosphoenolpyruvate--protein phosphotransferase [Lachnospiraceae bacterium]